MEKCKVSKTKMAILRDIRLVSVVSVTFLRRLKIDFIKLLFIAKCSTIHEHSVNVAVLYRTERIGGTHL